MSFIFISYSHKDRKYAHSLAQSLEQKGFEVWVDDRIDYGSTWPRVIEEQLDACGAFVVIMTPHSLESQWVQNEISRAMRKGKNVFPLLLEGEEPWISVESIQYVDVRGLELPADDFYARLRGVIPIKVQEVSTEAVEIKVERQFKTAQPTKLAVLIFLGMLSAFSMALTDSFRLNLQPLQILVVFFIGYNYGRNAGLISGVVLFLPNLLFYYFYYISYGADYGIYEKSIFYKNLQIGSFPIKSFSIISYVLFGVIGIISAYFKEKLQLYEDKVNFISKGKKLFPSSLFFLLIPAYLLTSIFYLDMLRVNFYLIVWFTLAFLSLKYGFSHMASFALWLVPIIVIFFRIDMIQIGGVLTNVDFLGTILAIVLIGHLKDPRAGQLEGRLSAGKRAIFVVLLIISYIFSFSYALGPDFQLRGYPLALALILLCGFIFGPYKGFLAGIVWTASGLIDFFATDRLTIFGTDYFFCLVAPILGYFGGTELFNKETFYSRACFSFCLVYAVMLVYRLLSGHIRALYYYELIVFLVQSIISVLLFYAVFGGLRKEA